MRSGTKVTKGKVREVPRFERGSGNVFEDLGLPDAVVLLAKSDLVLSICDTIKKRGLTQAQAARALGISQPKFSALIRGHLHRFSTDLLFRFLNDLGSDIEITVKPRRPASKRPSIRVIRDAG